MGKRQSSLRNVFVGGLLCMVCPAAQAAETGLSTYGLGGTAFGAGMTPPPGTYVTTAVAYYSGNIEGNVTIGRQAVDIGLKVNFLSVGLNGLYVPETKILGGQFGVSVTVPVGFVDIDARASIGPLTGQRSADGPGLGDIVPKLQLGWQHGSFAHTIYVQGVAPTGRYEPRFAANIGLNRPSIDTGWAFTWTDTSRKVLT